jgi:tRNA pseudouridine55 synthase
LFGCLNINKPAGWTSRDVVNRVQRLLPRGTKVGHAGTLDPLATGVLVVVVGPATRLVDYSHSLAKHYRGEFLLGRTSDSLDTETAVTQLADRPCPTAHDIEQALAQFIGPIRQTPPAYSAIKVGGLEAYKRARAGEQVAMPSRVVRIDWLAIVEYDYPRLVLDIVCGSGTYVRALGHDLAVACGSAAIMCGLTRTAVGPFELEAALPADGLSAECVASNLGDPLQLLGTMPRVTLSDDEVEDFRNGRFVPTTAPPAGEVAAVDRAGRLVAIAKGRGRHLLAPRLVFK